MNRDLTIKEQEIVDKVSFWAFTGKWAVIAIIMGIFLIYYGQFLIGILLSLIASGYIYWRLKKIK